MLTISLSQSPVQSGLVIFIYTYSKSRILSFLAYPTAFTYSNPIHNFQEKRRPPREKRNEKAINSLLNLTKPPITHSLTHSSMYPSSSIPISPFSSPQPLNAQDVCIHIPPSYPILSYPTLYTATTQHSNPPPLPPRLKSQSQSQSQSKPDKILPSFTVTLTLTLRGKIRNEPKKGRGEKPKHKVAQT